MMSVAQEVTRLLIADGVGVGKTIEAGLVAGELLATGDADRLAVLCSPQLAPQWQAELRAKFGINAELLLPSTATRLARGLPWNTTVYDHYRYLVISTDYIKQKNRRDEFAIACPDLVIVDEVHTAIAPTGVGSSQAHQRYTLLRRLADDPSRHLILLTATPHNGDEGAWQRLIGLLDQRLGELPADLSGPAREADRQFLARFLVQRQRADIREYLDEDTPFPNRQLAEQNYTLTDEYRLLFDRVIAYARETVADPRLNHVRQRVRWWSAIALLRCLASSPAAAEQTLLNRSDLAAVETVDEADALAGPRVFDSDLDDAADGEDAALGSDTGRDEHPDNTARRRLREFAREAAGLRGPKGDAKLKRAIDLVRGLLADGYHPILFCRYIPTAEYVADHLRGALKDPVRVEAVTGSLPPEEREDRVNDLMRHDGPRVLVATDCLSEGVNLQDGFTAVVHYDLAWNPTRHEQRVGRVDRFGQTAPTIRAVTYYGADNRIDGVVLDVLIRRHEAIKKATGVSVPVPVDSATVMRAVWESLLLRGDHSEQLTLDFETALPSSTASAVITEWQDAAEREKASRSRFRQAALRPEQVGAVLDEIRSVLGGPAEVERFVRDSLSLLGGQISPTEYGFSVTTTTLLDPVIEQLPPHKASVVRFRRTLPAPRGDALLTRTDSTVEALARYTLDAALDPQLPAEARPARRAAVVRTRDVNTATTLLVLRYRIELALPGRRRIITQIAEDARFLGYTTGEDDEPIWLTEEESARLLDVKATGNVLDELARAQLQRVLDVLPGLQEELNRRGIDIAEATADAHRKVRQTTGIARRGLNARLLPPADVLGIYVFLPDRSPR
jgi:superfamily II DNA or RNA helicase